MTMPDPYALWDAAYVLGSLSSDERREFELHLAGCDSCRSAVADLSGTPALLALLDRDSVCDEPPAAEVPPQMLGPLMSAVSNRRRRSRRALSVLSAAALLLAVGLAVAVWPTTPVTVPGVAALDLIAVTPSSYTATITMAEQGWGTDIAMACTYAHWPEESDDDDLGGDRLAMVAVGRDGSRSWLATWRAVTGTTALPRASTSLPVAEIAAVQVVSAVTGEVLLERTLDD